MADGDSSQAGYTCGLSLGSEWINTSLPIPISEINKYGILVFIENTLHGRVEYWEDL